MNRHPHIIALLLLSACSFEPVGQVQICTQDEDCAASQVCFQDRCTPEDLVDQLDMTGDLDAPDAPGDMRPGEDMMTPADMPSDLAPDLAQDMTPDLMQDMAPDQAPDMDIMPELCPQDNDQDGFGTGPNCPQARRDCDDSDRVVYPGAPQRCNGRDNDCDGQQDTGACDCQPGAQEACGPDEGACVAGQRTCQPNGRWGECTGGRGPAPETCNGEDDNCDGLEDETFPGQGDACDTGLAGVCQPGRKSCNAGVVTCAQRLFPAAESCDALDNDCDGLVDEDDDGLLLARPCGNMCPSRAVQLCLSGQWGACDVTDVELCNGQDTNCDTRVDNMSRCVRACPNGNIASGTQLCTAAGPVCELPEEICGDAQDNDCDGQIDESCNTPNDLRNMVFIPGNTFIMGAPQSDPYRQADETPLHLVELDPYYIDRYEVSRAQYQACVQAGACAQLSNQCPSQPLSGVDANKPIACIRWQDARDYCVWRGKRLPTEAEWERAARGPFPRAPLWPWGNTEDGALARMDCQTFSLNTCVATVDSFPNGASYDGLHHMAGNVAEYVADYYDDGFYTSQLATNPLRASMTAEGHVIRGGSWYQALRFGRTANRAAEVGFDFSRTELGVRCAKDAP